jgi:hypothetical protein
MEGKMGEIWSLVTKAHSGTVSILRGMSKEECRQVMRRLTPRHERPDYISGFGFVVQGSDIVMMEPIGPEGETIEVWTKEEWLEGYKRASQEKTEIDEMMRAMESPEEGKIEVGT